MISVVIPLYNKQSSIRSTIESVLNQTYSDYELIVVDDGSIDDGASVVAELSDPRIHLIRKENGGVSSARNVGIRQATSEYIAFLDGDDLWEPEFLEEINKMITDYPEAAIWGTSYFFLQQGAKVSAEKPLPDGFYGIIDSSTWNLAHVYCSTAVCCRKSALEEIGGFDERIAYGEDTEVWWQIMLRHPAVYSNRPLAVYRFDEENRAMNKIIPLEKLYINYFEKYESYRKENTAFRHFIDKECMWWLYSYYEANPKDPNVRRILKQINLREYKFSFWLRFHFPKLYKMLKGGKKQ